ncbi:hypothetical protein D3C85_1466470 [compost metagenome]
MYASYHWSVTSVNGLAVSLIGRLSILTINVENSALVIPMLGLKFPSLSPAIICLAARNSTISFAQCPSRSLNTFLFSINAIAPGESSVIITV